MAGTPWSNQVQNKVIVGGAKGGIFVYSGTPAANNLISSDAGAAGVDSFGNQYLGGFVTYSNQATGCRAIQQDINTNQIVFWTSTVAMNSTSPIWWQQAGNPGAVISQESTLNGGAFSGLHLNGGNNSVGSLFLDSSVAPIVARVPVAALLPGTSWTPATFQPLSLSGSWANNQTLEIRLMEDNTAEIHGQLTIPAGVTGPANTMATIPAAYRPPNRDEPVYLMESLTASPFTATAHFGLVRSGGNFDCFGAATQNNLMRIQVRYPLDGT